MQARFAFTEFFDSGYRFPIRNTDLPCSSRYVGITIFALTSKLLWYKLHSRVHPAHA